MNRSLLLRCVAIALSVALALLVRSPVLEAASGTMLPNGWLITPAGAITPLGTLPLHMAEDPSGRWLAVTNAGYGPLAISLIDERTGQAGASRPITGAFYGLAFSADGHMLYASTAAGDGVARFAVTPETGALADAGTVTLGRGALWIAGIAVATSGRSLFAAANAADTVLAVDPETGVSLWAAKVGSSPYGVALSKDERWVYVSNWGSSTVSVLDAKSGERKKNIAVGSHPNAELLSADGKTLYVACANDDSVAVIDTASGITRATLDAGIYPHAPPGAIPNGLALSTDGKTLFVADAGDNAIVALDLAAAGQPVFGAIPTGWYPTDVVQSRDGTKLFVLDGKGVSGHANPNFPHSDVLPPKTQSNDRDYVGALATGDVEMIPLPDRTALVSGLTAVRNNAAYNHLVTLPPVPNNLHVIYIIKENRTYDEVLGDDSRGNGDSRLAIFGEHVTPNIHRLARSFVLLDNFETDAAVSADGHNWSTAAYATDYVEKLWPATYDDRGRGYDFEQDGVVSPPAGYLWDNARRAGLTLRDYGEFVQSKGDSPATPSVASLEGFIDPNYHGFDVHYSDQDRINEWLREFHSYVANRNLPQLEIVRLPNDHTAATKPGAKTPYAMIADNDYALGRLVDAVSHSPYWRDTIIISVEDDAQAGPDHVSDHRAEALIIGARVRRGLVDHTHYTTSGALRTVEMLLGMQPMTQFDSGATPMYADITPLPNTKPWSASKPLVDLTTVNPGSADGKTSQSLNFAEADAADPATVNAILWRYAHSTRE